MADAEQALARVPLLASLSGRARRALARRMRERLFPAGTEVTSEGEGGVGFFVIDEGRAGVSVAGRDVRELGPGDHFGEIALIDRGARTATVTAITDLRCLGMSSWEFQPFVREHPDVAWGLLQTLVDRLRAAQATDGTA